MLTNNKPGLYGIFNSNRDLSDKDSWGKNKFNNNFPIALTNYMYSKRQKPIYLKLSKSLNIVHDKIDVKDLYKVAPDSSKIYFSFETAHLPYQRYNIGNLPRADVVISELGESSQNDKCLQSLEIKLTALPDNSTFDLGEDKYGCEIVIRPDTIVYLAFSIAEYWEKNRVDLRNKLESTKKKIDDWTDGSKVHSYLSLILDCLDSVIVEQLDSQKPLILQPVWKTVGKAPKLCENCLDVFVWSDLAFTRLFIDASREKSTTISRLSRSAIWLFNMLYDYAIDGKINHKFIIDSYTYNVKNDKAFSLTGKKTFPYMTCKELVNPRIKVDEIQNIILNGGERFLSPERRFDAVIVSAPGLFQ